MPGPWPLYGWQPGIGDPTLWGWLTVANYAVATGLALMAARADLANSRFWSWVAVLMVALGVNKQLDLQSLLTVVGRHLALAQHWYDQRREAQEIFIAVLAGLVALAMAGIAFHYRRRRPAVLTGIAGLALLGAFVIARAASFHHMDVLLNVRFLALRLNHLLENGGILIVAVSAALAARAPSRA